MQATSRGNNIRQTIIGGFEYISNLLFDSKALYFNGGTVTGYSLSGSLANRMVDATNNSDVYHFNDPMDTMLSSLQNIAFRAALKAGAEEGNNTITLVKQNIAYTGRESFSIYRTDYVSMIIAGALGLLTIGSVCAVLYGWWELGGKCQ